MTAKTGAKTVAMAEATPTTTARTALNAVVIALQNVLAPAEMTPQTADHAFVNACAVATTTVFTALKTPCTIAWNRLLCLYASMIATTSAMMAITTTATHANGFSASNTASAAAHAVVAAVATHSAAAMA